MPRSPLSPEMRELLKQSPSEVINELAILEDRALRAEQRAQAAVGMQDHLRRDVAGLRAENESLRKLLDSTMREIEAGLRRALVKAAG